MEFVTRLYFLHEYMPEKLAQAFERQRTETKSHIERLEKAHADLPGNLEGTTQTMPLAIYLGFERDLNVAVVLSVVLVIVTLIMLGITRRLDGIRGN